MPVARPSLRPATWALLIGAATLLSLALGEGLARTRESPVVATRLYFDASNDAYRLHRPAPGGLGYELSPGATFGDVHINALGLRGEETSLRKPAGTFRILLLGDSITLAAGMPLEDTYGAVLERALRARGAPAQVLNAGVIGYNAAQEALWFERHGAALAPDLVVVGFCMNDFGGTEIQRLEGDRWRVDVMVPAMVPLGLADGPFAVALTARSALFRAAQRMAQRLRGAPASTRIFDPQEHANAMAYERIRDAAKAGGASVAVALFPVLGPPDPEWSAVRGRIGAIGSALGLPMLDLAVVFAELPLEELRIAPDDPWHPGPRGHALAGEAIARFLVERGLVPLSASASGSERPA